MVIPALSVTVPLPSAIVLALSMVIPALSVTVPLLSAIVLVPSATVSVPSAIVSVPPAIVSVPSATVLASSVSYPVVSSSVSTASASVSRAAVTSCSSVRTSDRSSVPGAAPSLYVVWVSGPEDPPWPASARSNTASNLPASCAVLAREVDADRAFVKRVLGLTSRVVRPPCGKGISGVIITSLMVWNPAKPGTLESGFSGYLSINVPCM